MRPPRKARSQRVVPINSGFIASRDNRWLKKFRAALAGERGDEGMIGVEGARMVEAAFGSGIGVEAVLVSESGERHLTRLGRSSGKTFLLLRTSDRLFAGIADTKAPQGIAALVRPAVNTVETLLQAHALIVVLVGVQDPGNVGTIIRAAEAFGATGAAICAAGSLGTADPLSPKALRASAGSALRLPIVQASRADVLLKKFRAAGIKTYAAVAAASGKHESKNVELLPWEIDWKASSALLIGNEGAGLPEDIVNSCDARVFIPQNVAATAAGFESLNAAMAATVLLYEAARQRDSKS